MHVCMWQLCALCVDGQVEGPGAGEDEGGRQSACQGVLPVPARLPRGDVSAGEVQQQGCCSLQG